jgi:hypothetical protein
LAWLPKRYPGPYRATLITVGYWPSMSLTIFLHNKKPEVDIVRWFHGYSGPLVFAQAPIVTMPLNEFRSSGYEWICRHFEAFASTRLTDQEMSKHNDLFQSKTVKRVMEDSDVVEIDPCETHWSVVPYVVRRNVFPNGMEVLEKEKSRQCPSFCGADAFWETFDEVYQFTHWYSI